MVAALGGVLGHCNVGSDALNGDGLPSSVIFNRATQVLIRWCGNDLFDHKWLDRDDAITSEDNERRLCVHAKFQEDVIRLTWQLQFVPEHMVEIVLDPTIFGAWIAHTAIMEWTFDHMKTTASTS